MRGPLDGLSSRPSAGPTHRGICLNSDNTVVLKTTPAELWSLLVEPENIKRWNPDVVSDEALTPGPPGVGSKSAVRIREGSRIVEYESEVLTFEPGKLPRVGLEGCAALVCWRATQQNRETLGGPSLNRHNLECQP